MESYRVLIKPSAARELEAIPKKDRVRLVSKISNLAGNPRPSGSEKLSAQEQYRVRHGRYRVVYSISDAEKMVLVVKVAHRREVYR
ncbi:MAG TPA: type II toxin-antitoxin system RelE/ParE family toxin [Terriglobia bacterium]|nr:type II toxin-antitoxin system RelE/ParE family toxin [Terriglobia bacterium]